MVIHRRKSASSREGTEQLVGYRKQQLSEAQIIANYQAMQESTRQTDSAPFITFMLRMILDAVTTSAPQVTPQVGDLLAAIQEP